MKISRITFGHTSQPVPTQKKRSITTIDETNESLDSVYQQNYAYGIPFILSDTLYSTEEHNVDENDTSADIFRDNEMFDPARDDIENGYSSYDEDDIRPVKQQFFNPVKADYLLNKDCDFDLNSCFNTENPIVSDIPPGYNITNLKIFQDEEDKEKYLSTIKLTKNCKTSINGKLRREVNRKLDNYDLKTVAAITNTAKLEDRNENESVNYALFEEGFKLANHYSCEDVQQIMNTCVLKDDLDNEYYSNRNMQFIGKLLTNLSVDKAVVCGEHAVSYSKETGYYFDGQKADRIAKLLKVYPYDEAFVIINQIKPDVPLDN